MHTSVKYYLNKGSKLAMAVHVVDVALLSVHLYKLHKGLFNATVAVEMALDS